MTRQEHCDAAAAVAAVAAVAVVAVDEDMVAAHVASALAFSLLGVGNYRYCCSSCQDVVGHGAAVTCDMPGLPSFGGCHQVHPCSGVVASYLMGASSCLHHTCPDAFASFVVAPSSFLR
jgi:hypothetical protein